MALVFFLRNICTEILDECQKENIDCNSNFILYYLQLLSLDPLWNLFHDMKEINRLDALRLIKFVVAKMKNQQCPCIISLKIMMYFNCNFEEKATIVHNERFNFKNRLKPLGDEIIKTSTTDLAEIDNLKKKIIFYITLWRGLGNPTEAAVYREARQVLYSIYDDSDILFFMEKRYTIKEEELLQLSQICAGIRIFNWSCDKGGNGMENLPELLKDVIENINYAVQIVLAETMDKINLLTTAVDYSFTANEVESYVNDVFIINYVSICNLPDEITYEDMEYFKDLIIVYRQLEVLLRKLTAEIDSIERDCTELDLKLRETLDYFHSLVYLKVGVPTDIVFPVFIKLDAIWEEYQNDIIYIAKLNQILQNLEKYVKDLFLNMDLLESILDNREILSDAQRLTTLDLNFQPSNSSIAIVPPNSETQLDEIELEFLGFCPWKLVESQGGLIPGNPHLGILQFKGKCYAFSSPEAAKAFDQHPEKFINESLELARKKTELIPLLQLEDHLQEVQMIKELVRETKESKVKIVVQQDMDMQTDIHPIKSRIDENYMWNIWDWKRQALCMADLSRKLTRATQTESSSNKNPVVTQTYEQKEQECQTRIDNYCNVATPQTFFFGLRGRTDNKQFILNLTRPVDK